MTDCAAVPLPFALAPLTLIADRRLTSSEMRLLLALLTFADADGVCWPSRAALAKRLQVSSLSRLSATISRCVRLGWLTVTHRQGTNLYRITPPASTPQEPAQRSAPDDPAPPVPSSTPGWRAAGHPGVETEQTREPTTFPPLPSTGDACQTSRQTPSTRPEPPDDTAESMTTTQKKDKGQTPQGTQERAARLSAAQRLVAQLNAATGLTLPTAPTRSIIRRTARRLRIHTEAQIAQVIATHAATFRHPAALLKPAVLEALIAEGAQRQAEQARREQREHAQLAAIRAAAAPQQRSKQVGAQGLAALRSMLGRSGTPA